MRIAMIRPLFALEIPEDGPSLGTIQRPLASIPDARLLEGLRQHRGRGRDDYPVHMLWGAVLLRVVLRHVSVEAMPGKLRPWADPEGPAGIPLRGGVAEPGPSPTVGVHVESNP